MRIAFLGQDFVGLESGAVNTNDHYGTQLAYCLNKYGYDVSWYYKSMGNQIVIEENPWIDVHHFYDLKNKDFDILISNLNDSQYEEIKDIIDLREVEIYTSTTVDVDVNLGLPAGDGLTGNIYNDGKTIYHGYISNYPKESFTMSKGAFIPQYIPPPEIDIPFEKRRNRFMNATPAEDLRNTYELFFTPLHWLRKNDFGRVVSIHRQRLIYELASKLIQEEREFYKSKGMEIGFTNRRVAEYIEHSKLSSYFGLLEGTDNIIFPWVSWREHLRMLSDIGVYFRYSWHCHKTGIPEALAYGCIVILSRTHSHPYYDYDDVELIPWRIEDVKVDGNGDNLYDDDIFEKTYEKMKEILFDKEGYFSERSKDLSEKYLERHGLPSIKNYIKNSFLG